MPQSQLTHSPPAPAPLLFHSSTISHTITARSRKHHKMHMQDNFTKLFPFDILPEPGCYILYLFITDFVICKLLQGWFPVSALGLLQPPPRAASILAVPQA